MGSFGDYYHKTKKKLSRQEMAKKAAKSGPSFYVAPQPTVIGKGKKKDQAW